MEQQPGILILTLEITKNAVAPLTPPFSYLTPLQDYAVSMERSKTYKKLKVRRKSWMIRIRGAKPDDRDMVRASMRPRAERTSVQSSIQSSPQRRG